MENTKYILTDVSKEVLGVKLFQIKALVAFGNVSKDELGGWIEKEGNLSQDGDAWVYGDAMVYGNYFRSISCGHPYCICTLRSGYREPATNMHRNSPAWRAGKYRPDLRSA